MNNQLFREKSIKRVSSPEQLNEYVKVASPGVWMVLASVILLLIGVCIWGVFGRMTTTVQAGAQCQDGVLTCYISEADASAVAVGMTVTVDGQDYEISEISGAAQELSEETDSRLLHIGALSAGAWVYEAKADTELSDGVYEAVITTESISPMSFIIN